MRDLVASTVSARPGGNDAPSMSEPGATPRPPGVPWHTPAQWHHLDTQRTAWCDLGCVWVGGAGQKSSERTPETDRLT
jgi:hypothetical protein